MIDDTLQVKGEFIAVLTDPKTGMVVVTYRTPNLVTNGGKNHLARMLLDITGYDTGLTYQALGTGIMPASTGDIALVTETARQRVTSRADTIGNVARFATFFSATQIGVAISEVGIFGHTTARSTAGTGTLFARALLPIDNSGGNDLTLTYSLTIT